MATVTIGRSYFEALLRRAEFHTSLQDIDFGPNLLSNVTISKAEHGYLVSASYLPRYAVATATATALLFVPIHMNTLVVILRQLNTSLPIPHYLAMFTDDYIPKQLQAERDYNLLKSALFRGGLTNDTLDTLLEGESGAATDEAPEYDYHTEKPFAQTRAAPVGLSSHYHNECSPTSEGTAVDGALHYEVQPRTDSSHVVNSSQLDFSIDSPSKGDGDQANTQRVPLHDQRTVLITNLSERTTHKDLAGVIRGGRLLDIFLRTDRSATVSFVEGAADFLSHTKRNDIYLHTKRLEFRWADRQFHVLGHVSNKIASGATRNLVVRGAAGKLSADQIRDHLDHIHNLVVVSINFKKDDAYISTNSIHNALFARTCMMSRTVYKGLRIDYYPDECAAQIPRSTMKPRIHTPPTPLKTKLTTNIFALLDTSSDTDSDSEIELDRTEGIHIDHHDWADATSN
ncbi:hypothetical protein GQ44DRAFT_766525 [Phaeosphaeriaceae sp. PMI808]|nr:hypothetical protein GQ44DRAFT_766525 [Phaeosphaeriaceae sp. PMI808]